jgi:hypothetical protein
VRELRHCLPERSDVSRPDPEAVDAVLDELGRCARSVARDERKTRKRCFVQCHPPRLCERRQNEHVGVRVDRWQPVAVNVAEEANASACEGTETSFLRAGADERHLDR